MDPFQNDPSRQGPSGLPPQRTVRAPNTAPQNLQWGWNRKIGLILFFITGPILALEYWSHGGGLMFLGKVPIDTLYAVAAAGGAISFFIFADAWMLRVIGMIPGALAGFGAFYIHILYTSYFQKTTVYHMESILVGMVGALPGIILFAVLWKIVGNKPDDSPQTQ